MSLKTEMFNVASVLAGRSLDGLAFVPDVCDRFEVGGTEATNRAACHEVLLRLEKDRHIELVAPPFIQGTTRQLALCPVSALRGTLAWIRITNYDGFEDES
jgi:hypothetical protein